MAHEFLSVTEWLESQRLAGCEWAPELLDLVDSADLQDEMAGALEDIQCRMPPDIIRKPELDGQDYWRIANWACDRLDLLESLEEVLAEFSEGFTCANGTRPVDLDDLLRAMFESSRWQTLDL